MMDISYQSFIIQLKILLNNLPHDNINIQINIKY